MDNHLAHSHDKFFKVLFSRKEAVSEFIEKFLPARLANHIELASLQLDNTEYVDKKLKAHFSDLVYNGVYNTSDDEKSEPIEIKISFLFEHKSSPEQYPHFQLLRYMLNMWETQLKQKQKLTPVIPIIFYHGKRKWHEKPFADYFPKSDDVLQEFMPHFDYLLLDTAKHSNSEFQALSDLELQMGLMMMKHISNPNSLLNQLNNIFADMGKLFTTEQGNHYFETIVMYLVHNTDLTTETLVEKMNTATLEHKEKFVSTAMRLRMEGIEEGIQKGLQKGLLRGRSEEKFQIAKNLKQIGLSDADIVKATGLSIAEIKKLSN